MLAENTAFACTQVFSPASSIRTRRIPRVSHSLRAATQSISASQKT